MIKKKTERAKRSLERGSSACECTKELSITLVRIVKWVKCVWFWFTFFIFCFVLHFEWRSAIPLNDCRDTFFPLRCKNRDYWNRMNLSRGHHFKMTRKKSMQVRLFGFIIEVFFLSFDYIYSWNTKTISLLGLSQLMLWREKVIFIRFDTHAHTNPKPVNEPPIYLSNAQFYQNIHVKCVFKWIISNGLSSFRIRWCCCSFHGTFFSCGCYWLCWFGYQLTPSKWYW